MPPARPSTKAAARAAARESAPEPPGGSRFARFNLFQRGGNGASDGGSRGGSAGGGSRGGRATSGAAARSATAGSLIRDVRAELKRVEWPNREQLVKLTGAVCVLSILVGSILGTVDFLFQELFRFILSLAGGV